MTSPIAPSDDFQRTDAARAASASTPEAVNPTPDFSAAHGAWRVSYQPGEWTLLSGPSAVVVLEPAPGRASEVVTRIWELALSASGPDDLVSRLSSVGLDAMPNLALVFRDGFGLRALLRGDVRLTDAEGADLGNGAGVRTWREVELPATVVDVHLPTGGRSADQLTLPMLTGAARSGWVRIDVSQDALPDVAAPWAGQVQSSVDGSGDGAADVADEAVAVEALPTPEPTLAASGEQQVEPEPHQPEPTDAHAQPVEDAGPGPDGTDAELVDVEADELEPQPGEPESLAAQDDAADRSSGPSFTGGAALASEAVPVVAAADAVVPPVPFTEAVPPWLEVQDRDVEHDDPADVVSVDADVVSGDADAVSADADADDAFGERFEAGQSRAPELNGIDGAPENADQLPEHDEAAWTPAADEAHEVEAQEVEAHEQWSASDPYGAAAVPAPSGPYAAVPAWTPMPSPADVRADLTGAAHEVQHDDRPTDAPLGSGGERGGHLPAVHAQLRTSAGDRVLVTGPVLIGRAPSPRGDSTAQLLRVPSPSQDISRTHLLIDAPDGQLQVTDLHSTNGTIITSPDGATWRLSPGVPVPLEVGTIIDLGDGVTIDVAPHAG